MGIVVCGLGATTGVKPRVSATDVGSATGVSEGPGITVGEWSPGLGRAPRSMNPECQTLGRSVSGLGVC